MTTLTGIKDAQYLAQFLGKKIAIRAGKEFHIYPILYSINADGEAQVIDSLDRLHVVSWKDCENPYVIMIMQDVEIVTK